jgi:hypothetical protein
MVVVDDPAVGDDDRPVVDPYQTCERGCTHDLARGVLISELQRGDGSFVPVWSTFGGVVSLAEAFQRVVQNS